MGSDMVVFFDPAIDCGLGLAGGLEPVGVWDFVAKRAVETFVISIFPWRAWVNVNRFNTNALEPCLEGCRHKFRAII